MKGFKYKLAYKISSQQEADELVSKLKELGYRWMAMDTNDWRRFNYLVTTWGNEKGLGYNDFGYTRSVNCELITNKDLFIALAAMVEGDEFYVGEWVVRTNYRHSKMNVGDITYVTKINGPTSIVLAKDEDDSITHMGSNLRKLSKEELIAHFIPKAEPVDTKKYVRCISESDNKFTGGQLYEVFGSEMQPTGSSKIGGKYVRIINDQGVLELYPLNGNVWKFEDVINNVNQDIIMNKFTVEGSKHLKQALVNELVDKLKLDRHQHLASAISDRVITDDNLEWDGQRPIITVHVSKHDTHYVLPQDYDKVLERFSEAFLSLLVPEYVECVKWNGELATAGRVYEVKDGKIKANNVELHWENYARSDNFKRSTKEAFEAQKPKKVKFTITTDYDTYELVITNNGVRFGTYAESVTIDKLKATLDALTGIKCPLGIRTKLRINIGCQEQIKGVTGTNIRAVIDEHNKYFN